MVVVVLVSATAFTGSGRAQTPQEGVLEPAGGGNGIVSIVGGQAVACTFHRAGGVPQLRCDVRRNARIEGFLTTMDPNRVAFLRVRTNTTGNRIAPLAAVSQQAGAPVYGAFQSDPNPTQIELANGATIGFLGTNIACSARRDGRAPALLCLAHAGPGLPGPCCGPSFGLLVGSYGFFLSPRRLEELRVVTTGVYSGSGTHPPPDRIVNEWRS